MKRVLLFLFIYIQLAIPLCVSAQTDVIFYNQENNQYMSLDKNLEDMPMLLVYDAVKVEHNGELLTGICEQNISFTKKELASLLGVSSKRVKAYMVRTGTSATSVWGTEGFNGVVEVLSPKMYRQLKKKNKLLSAFKKCR